MNDVSTIKPVKGLGVMVDGNLEKALKKFKKKLKKAGILEEYRDRRYFTKKSDKKHRQKQLARYIQQQESKKQKD